MPSKPVCLYEVISVSERDFDTMDDALRPIYVIWMSFVWYSMTSGIGLRSDMTLEGPRRCDTFAHDEIRGGPSHDVNELREELLRRRWNVECV